MGRKYCEVFTAAALFRAAEKLICNLLRTAMPYVIFVKTLQRCFIQINLTFDLRSLKCFVEKRSLNTLMVTQLDARYNKFHADDSLYNNLRRVVYLFSVGMS